MGGGNTPKLRSLEDKLFFILLFTRLYPLEIVLGWWFDVSEATACRWIHRLLPVLNQTLEYQHMMPKRGKGRSLEEIIAEYPDLRGVLTDGMEQPIRRPKNPDKQTDNYSGKKKRHTNKHVVITHPKTTTILYLSHPAEGKTHDKTIMDDCCLTAKTNQIVVGGDKGFQGLRVGHAKIITPTKKPKGKELTESQLNQNHAFGSIRTEVEHAICGLKRSHLAAEILRQTKTGFIELSTMAAAGLHNYRVSMRPSYSH
jgi:hypothetical protein